jgi:hypothetical protein
LSTTLGRIPLLAHAGLLAAALLLAAVVIGEGAFSADEGAAIIQAQALADGDGWLVDHPFPEADATDRTYPYEYSLEGDDGIAPFAKHPTYALLLAAGDLVAGWYGMVVLSVLGTVVAAWGAARLATRLDPSIEVVTLWAVGLGTPLLFDASLLIAHSLSAAGAMLAALAAVRVLEGGSRWWLAGVVASILAAGLVRNEALLFAPALAVGALAWERSGRALASGAAAVGAGVVAHQLNGVLQGMVVGGVGATQPPSGLGESTFVADRLEAFQTTWLRAHYDPMGSEGTALLLGVLLFVGAVLALRFDRVRVGVVCAVAGAVLIVGRVLVADVRVVPGLLVAVPVLTAGVFVVDRAPWRAGATRLAGVTVALFWGAVLMTQYRAGGSGEWGGRYFAMGLPLAVPLVLAGLAAIGRERGERAVRPVWIGLGVATGALAVLSLQVARVAHEGTLEFAALLAAETAGESADGGPPVIVATGGFVPRMAWDIDDDRRMLLVRADADTYEDDLRAVADRLDELGIEEWTFVTNPFDEVGLGVVGEGRTVGEGVGPDDSRWFIYQVAGPDGGST